MKTGGKWRNKKNVPKFVPNSNPDSKFKIEGNRNKNIKIIQLSIFEIFEHFFDENFIISKLFELPNFYGNHYYNASWIIIIFSLWILWVIERKSEGHLAGQGQNGTIFSRSANYTAEQDRWGPSWGA